MMKWLIVVGLCVCLGACAPFSGGAIYRYEYQTPDGKIVNLKVESTREVDEGVVVTIDPETGKVKVKTGAMAAGANNTQILLESMIRAFMQTLQAATPMPGT